MTVHIAMATFNGAQWLEAQLLSIQRQTDPAWRLLVADDGSDDATVSLIRRFAATDSRITLLEDSNTGLGPSRNFERVLSALRTRGIGTHDAIALCDQDDVWDPQKLALQSDVLERAFACCSELVLTDEAGRDLSKRFLQTGGATRHPTLCSMLAQNSVVGCTLVMRPEVLTLAMPFPRNLLNHDWWLGLCALALGQLECLEQPLVAYRQHAQNAIGAFRPMSFLRRPWVPLHRQQRVLRSQLEAIAVLQTRALEAQLPLAPAACEALDAYQRGVGSASAWRRASTLATGPFAAPFYPLRALRCLASLGVKTSDC